MDIYFIVWAIIQYTAFILLFGMFQLWLFGALSPFDIFPPVSFSFPSLPFCFFPPHSLFLLEFFYFLAQHNIPGKSDVFPFPVLELPISPRKPGSFYWRMILESNIWVLAMPAVTGVLLLLNSQMTEQGNICV